MRLLKHENCTDVAFQIITRMFEGKQSEHWGGYWWTIGTTGLYRVEHDSFFVPAWRIPQWKEYKIPVELELIR